MNRRGFLAGMLALGAAPAIVTSKGLVAALEPRIIGADYGRGDHTVIVRGDVRGGVIEIGRIERFNSVTTPVIVQPGDFYDEGCRYPINQRYHVDVARINAEWMRRIPRPEYISGVIPTKRLQVLDFVGGVDGTRTRDPRRDRPGREPSKHGG
jgi:hypothetical protein